MRSTIDHPDITTAELHRRDLQRVAARVRCRERAPCEPVSEATSQPVLAERRRLIASLAQMWDSADETAIEHADPLGVWSYDRPRRPLVTLDVHMVLDWGAWIVLVVLAGYLAVGH